MATPFRPSPTHQREEGKRETAAGRSPPTPDQNRGGARACRSELHRWRQALVKVSKW
jgi:hypothetical protein